ncbi:tetratricopeptide repeat protein [Nocardia sp. NPDC127526]|uniref:tetratricopeptide repeat protein n=1 Tax=Nocardia sp. NPDC127526 TaxID=3345393 RepID=UPI00362A20DA
MSDKLDKAWLLMGLGRYDAARELLAELLATDPDDPSALAGLAEVALRMGEYERALDHTGSALRVSPEFTMMWRVRALAEYQLTRDSDIDPEQADRYRDSAVAAARHAVELDPDDVDNLRILALVQQDSDPVAALEHLKSALEIDPDQVELHILRGSILRRYASGTAAFELAAQSLHQALGLDPERADALFELGLVELELGDFDAGQEKVRRAAQYDPSYGDVVRLLFEQIEQERARRAEAAAALPALTLEEAARAAETGRLAGRFEPMPRPQYVAPPPAPSKAGRWIGVVLAILVVMGLNSAFNDDGRDPRDRWTPSTSTTYSPPFRPPVLPPSYFNQPFRTWPSNIPRPTFLPRPTTEPAPPRVTLPPNFNPYG